MQMKMTVILLAGNKNASSGFSKCRQKGPHSTHSQVGHGRPTVEQTILSKLQNSVAVYKIRLRKDSKLII